MTDLPCCKLCGQKPVVCISGLIECSHDDCIAKVFTSEQWRKLMYVPEKKTGEPFGEIGYADGWNDCVDAMSKGGEL